jgi:hypothetical protein
LAALVAAGLGAVLPPGPAGGVAPPARPAHPTLAYLHRGCVYAIQRPFWLRKALHEVPDKQMKLCRAPLTADGLGAQRKFPVGWHAEPKDFIRWRIGHGSLWLAYGPVGSLHGILSHRLAEIQRAKARQSIKGHLLYPLDPLVDLAMSYRALLGAEGVFPPSEASFDFLVEGKGRVRPLLAWRGQIRAWGGTLRPSDDMTEDVKWDGAVKVVDADTEEEEWQYPPAWKAKSKVRGPFHAFADRSRIYFVTASGQLHACPRKGGPTKLLWGDKKRPIRALVADADPARTFAFTDGRGRGGKGGAVYFELAPKLRPVAYDRGRIAPARLGEPLADVAGYVRVLLRAKKIKPAR